MQSKCVETLVGKLRREFKPRIPTLVESLSGIEISVGPKTSAMAEAKEIERLFPLSYGQPVVDIGNKNVKDDSSAERKSQNKDTDIAFTKTDKKVSTAALRIGVVLSGGCASGGHNVICGLFDALKELNKDSVLLGFTGGPKGVMINRFVELTADFLDAYRNTGGFDMIQSGRDKISTQEQMAASLKTMADNNLDGLVVIGGDDSNTNAAVLAEFFAKNKSKCTVVGIPKTIDGDLQNEYIEMSFGFDTAVKTFAEMISNICRDAVSAAKTWHFVKLMGRDASQVTLDVALQTQPNLSLIGEEIQSENLLLHDVTENMVNIIEERALQGRNYGVVLIPEGVIQFIPSMKVLIDFLNETLKEGSKHLEEVEKLPELSDKIKYVRDILGKDSKTNLSNFDVLPRDIQAQLLLERDPHGNIQMSQVPIEQLFIQICDQKLRRRAKYVASKTKFRGQGHFFGYDGRSCYPSNFDAQYCNALGRVGTLLIASGMNGYMARVYDLEHDVKRWKCGAIPITMLMNIEIRHGKPKPVIKKCLVDVENGKKFSYFIKRRDDWAVDDCYRYLGPIQFFGPTALTDVPPFNVLLKKTNDVKWPLNK
eukprot:CAMPEP_0202726274 /NCGR_PEP_ID=MMETSP1385-20130828/184528_1 /ASSEMBLY_ACC=CAM_ASM_000861 /TAXON_ID=933848 /ORGANISM="Elphidium margaritaceum" /LENGTH=594 /DNA_ID=CAMNT_0049392491 /DNA_START=97 /DNA_END=1881 /DNA_ORIENTATION=+